MKMMTRRHRMRKKRLVWRGVLSYASSVTFYGALPFVITCLYGKRSRGSPHGKLQREENPLASGWLTGWVVRWGLGDAEAAQGGNDR